MLLPPPGLFSITTGWPSFSCSHCAVSRASTSVVPPGGYGTTQCTARFGYCASTAGAAAKSASSASVRRHRRCIGISSGVKLLFRRGVDVIHPMDFLGLLDDG